MFVSPSHELHLINGIRWLKSISLQEVHSGHLTKHYLLVTALAQKWSNARRHRKKWRLNKTKTQQIIITKNMINQHLTDIIWRTNQHNKVRNACFFFNNQTIKGEKRTVDAEDVLLTVIFCGICCHQVPRLWTVSMFTFPHMIEEVASRKSSLPSCGGKIPFINTPSLHLKTAFLHLSVYERMCTW